MDSAANLPAKVKFPEISVSPKKIATYGSGAFFCILLGFALAFFPWWLCLSILALPLVVFGAIAWIFPILAVVLALIFQAIPGEFVPLVGSFRIYELILIYLVIAVVSRELWFRRNPLLLAGPFLWPLLYLYICVLISAIYVKYFSPNPNLLYAIRGFVPWLIIPLLSAAVDSRRRAQNLFYLIIGIALIVSIWVMIESITNIKLLDNRTEVLDVTNSDITRSLAGGTTYLMVFSLIWAASKVIAGSRLWYLLICVAIVSAGGLAVGFGRGVWLATCGGFLIAAWITRGFRGMVLSAFLGGMLLSLLLLGFSTVKPRMVDAVIERALGVSDEVKSGGSFRWRQLENERAMDALLKKPFTGVGIGGEYKNTVSQVGTFANETQYIHNAYMGLMVKMGFGAILFPISMIWVFIMLARQTGKSIEKVYRPLYGAIVGAFFVPVITSFTQPEWIEGTGVAAICVLISSLNLLRSHGLDKPVE